MCFLWKINKCNISELSIFDDEKNTDVMKMDVQRSKVYFYLLMFVWNQLCFQSMILLLCVWFINWKKPGNWSFTEGGLEYKISNPAHRLRKNVWPSIRALLSCQIVKQKKKMCYNQMQEEIMVKLCGIGSKRASGRGMTCIE
jgi:hypothetical protein